MKTGFDSRQPDTEEDRTHGVRPWRGAVKTIVRTLRPDQRIYQDIDIGIFNAFLGYTQGLSLGRQTSLTGVYCLPSAYLTVIIYLVMPRALNPALTKPMTLSPELEAVVGKGPMPRSEVVKQIWVYIKKHDLQNPKNKRNILADDKLMPVFGGKKEVTMFEMTKLVSAHLK